MVKLLAAALPLLAVSWCSTDEPQTRFSSGQCEAVQLGNAAREHAFTENIQRDPPWKRPGNTAADTKREFTDVYDRIRAESAQLETFVCGRVGPR
jgi:hypothetical protein